MNVSTANCSISHTTGNITFIMIEYLKGLFPPKFFKHVHITSRMPYREFLNEDSSRDGRLIKKNKPLLIVRPKVIQGDPDMFMSMSRLVRNVEGYGYRREGGMYLPLFRDNVHDITMDFLMNRFRVQLDCSILLETEYMQNNVYNMLLNMHNDSQIYWMKCATEVLVPYPYINAISEIIGHPVRDPETGTVRKFLQYLCMNSNRYFTFKEKSASQEEEFFVYNPITMEYIFNNYSKDDVNRKNDVSETATISFSMSSEFNSMALFRLAVEQDDVLQKANAALHIDSSHKTKIIPFYTVTDLFKEVDEDGWKLFYSNMFYLDNELDMDVPDPLDISGIFKETTLKELFDYNKKVGQSNDILVKFHIMKNSVVLKRKPVIEAEGDYYIDYDKQEILIYDKDYSATYRIVIYLNNLYIVSLTNRLNAMDASYEEDIHKKEKGTYI